MFSVKSSILAALNWPLPNVNAKQAGVSSKMLAPAKLLTCTATHKVIMTRIPGHVGKSEEIPIASAISSRTSEDFSPKTPQESGLGVFQEILMNFRAALLARALELGFPKKYHITEGQNDLRFET
jgi:hypothetical protein